MSPAVTSNLVVAVMHFFGMETENDNPVRNCPSAQESSYDLMGKFVDKYIFPVWSGENDQCTDLKGTMYNPNSCNNKIRGCDMSAIDTTLHLHDQMI